MIEADGTSITPYEVSGVSIDIAQRYSVLLRTNQTAGAYWMRATVSQDSFTVSSAFFLSLRPSALTLNTSLKYTEPGFNGNILGVVRYGTNDTAMPNATLADDDPGAGTDAPADLDVSLLFPADAMTAPNSTL